MVKVANLSADLTANTTSFDKNLTRARRQLATTGRSMSKNADSFNKKVSLSFRRAAQNAAAFEGPLGGIAGRLSGLAGIANTTGVALGGTLLAIAGLTVAMVKGVKVADEYEGSMNRLNAILLATGNASGQSAEGIREFSRELAAGTLASVAGVEAASAKLLTFRRISGDTFKRTIVLAQDLAATGFGSLSDNVTQLGKALEDPIRNLGALTRNGISFTSAQKDMIKSLVESGRALEAQTIILDALAGQVGGAGAAEGGAIAKGVDLMSQRFDELTLSLDNFTNASVGTARTINGLRIVFEGLTGLFTATEDLPLTEQLKLANETLLELTKTASKPTFDALGGTGDLDDRIDAQNELIRTIERNIAIEKEHIANLKKEGELQQQLITAEAERDRLAKERQKIADAEAKRFELAKAQIKGVIDGLREEVEARRLEIQLIKEGGASLEEAALEKEIFLALQKNSIDLTEEESAVLDDLIRRRTELNTVLTKEQKLRAAAKKAIESNRTEVEKLNVELELLNELFDKGLLTAAQYEELFARVTVKINDLSEEQKQLREISESVGDAMRDTFEDVAFGAKSAGDAVRQLGIQLLKLAFQKSTEGFFEAGISAFGTAIAGSFADGGRPPVGRVSMVGEEGPELFIPDSAGTIIPNDALSSGGKSGPTIFADMRGASVEAVARLELFVEQLNGSIEPRAISAVAGEKQRNPQLFGV